MENSKKAKRIIDTWTGKWEKKNLPKMARALPKWVTPDHLTVLGLIAGLIIAAGYILSWLSPLWLLLSNFGLLLHWYADSLDGTLARVRHKERERYGYFVDHICDAWTVSLICIALGLSPFLQFKIGLFLIVGYLLLNIYAHISAYTMNTFRISFGKFGPTEVRIIVGIINFALLFWKPQSINLGIASFSLVDIAGIIVASIFIIIFIIVSINSAVKLAKEDIPRNQNGNL